MPSLVIGNVPPPLFDRIRQLASASSPKGSWTIFRSRTTSLTRSRIVFLIPEQTSPLTQGTYWTSGKRVASLASPYREHLARHFAVTYMRVALPEPYGTQP
jgi:hypothetical protein